MLLPFEIVNFLLNSFPTSPWTNVTKPCIIAFVHGPNRLYCFSLAALASQDQCLWVRQSAFPRGVGKNLRPCSQRLGKTAKEKQSYLLGLLVNYSCKKSHNIGHRYLLFCTKNLQILFDIQLLSKYYMNRDVWPSQKSK
jgi:hypothetical protein